MLPKESEILRNLRLVEGLKADLVTSVAEVYQAMAQNRPQEEVVENLAQTIIGAYVLGRRLGIDYERLDEIVIGKIGHNIAKNTQAENWFGDLSQLKRHLKNQ
ncbi:MAG: MazG-like family protein [Sporomusaceae bacterium]|nr:MazG-like family protein [Sporomusaceae bacterium]